MIAGGFRRVDSWGRSTNPNMKDLAKTFAVTLLAGLTVVYLVNKVAAVKKVVS